MKFTPVLLLAALSLFSGCQEYTFNTPEEHYSVPGQADPLPNTWLEDVFRHPTKQPADILFVIDKSCSMIFDDPATGISNTENINQNIPEMFNILDDYNIDYQVAVMSTDGFDPDEAGRLGSWQGRRWVTPEDSDPAGLFASMNANASGPYEHGLAAVWASMTTRLQENIDFFRVGAPLHIITITDEPDQSVDIGPFWVALLLQQARNYKEADVDYSIIVHTPEDPHGCGASPSQLGTGYLELARYENDLILDICDRDWSSTMRQLAEYRTERVFEYTLRGHPVVETIEVFVEDEGITFTPEWTYIPVRNSVMLVDFIPDEDAVVRITYADAVHYTPPEETDTGE